MPMFLLAYRSAVHDTTGLTPAQVLFGKELRLPYNLVIGASSNEEVTVEDYVDDVKMKLHMSTN